MISASPVTAQHTNMRDTAMHVQQHSPKTTWPGCGKTPLPRFFVVTITPPSPDTSLAAMPVSKVDRRAQLRLAGCFHNHWLLRFALWAEAAGCREAACTK